MIKQYNLNRDAYDYILRMQKMYWTPRWMNFNPGELILYDIMMQKQIDKLISYGIEDAEFLVRANPINLNDLA